LHACLLIATHPQVAAVFIVALSSLLSTWVNLVAAAGPDDDGIHVVLCEWGLALWLRQSRLFLSATKPLL
jgi:hypothetical protein